MSVTSSIPRFISIDANFVESTANINNHYDTVLKLLDSNIDALTPRAPSQLEGARMFGEILHTSQDFYSHSNWVELQNAGLVSKQQIVDDGLNKSIILSPNTAVKNTKVVVIEGSKPNPTAPDASLTRPNDGHIVFKGQTPALISGFAFDNGACPENHSIGPLQSYFQVVV